MSLVDFLSFEFAARLDIRSYQNTSCCCLFFTDLMSNASVRLTTDQNANDSFTTTNLLIDRSIPFVVRRRFRYLSDSITQMSHLQNRLPETPWLWQPCSFKIPVPAPKAIERFQIRYIQNRPYTWIQFSCKNLGVVSRILRMLIVIGGNSMNREELEKILKLLRENCNLFNIHL